MAVEATHLNLFPSSQLLQDIESVTSTPYNHNQGNMNTQPTRFSGTAFGTTFNDNSPVVNTESGGGATFNNINQGQIKRKQSRELMNQFYVTPSFVASSPVPPQKTNNNCISMFVGGDFLPQIQQNQLEIDDIITRHTKKIRLELEERQKQQAKWLATAIGQGVMKRIKEKDDQIQRIAKSNLFLEEKVKNLSVENELWKDLAQSNEATANTLRSNLEQVMSQIAVEEEDLESCCGSNGGDEEEREEEESDRSRRRMCRKCGERESCVLLLPCRHLCLCNFCGGSGSHQLQTCPVCNTIMNASLHVNQSS